MKISDLEPVFLRLEDLNSQNSTMYHTDDLSISHGVLFWCPVCRDSPKGHYVLCWDPSVPPIHSPGPGRWKMTGAGFNDLSLAPSVQLHTACRAHFFVRNGEIHLC